MPLCPKCGTQLRETDRFCPSCGQPTTMPGQAPPAPAPAPHTTLPAAPRATVGGCRTIAIILAVLVALATVFVVGLLMLVFGITAPAVESAQAHLDALRAGKVEEAYASTAQAFKDATPLPEYRRFLESYPALSRVKTLSLSERSVRNENASLRGSVTTDDDDVLPVSIRLVREKDQWRVIGIEVEPAGPAETKQ